MTEMDVMISLCKSLTKKIEMFRKIDILDLIETNYEIDDYSVKEKETLKNWNDKVKEILND